MFELEMFPARDGDALVLSWGEADRPRRMLIDAGRESGWAAINKAFKALPPDQRLFELLVVTHVDADHIAGVLKMLADPARTIGFRQVWFNAYHHLVGGSYSTFGPDQGEALSDILRLKPEIWNRDFAHGAVVIEDDGVLPSVTIEGLKLTILSPTRSKLQALAPVWKRTVGAEKLGRTEEAEREPPPRPQIPEGYQAFGPRPDVEAIAALPASEDDKPANGSSIAFSAEFEGKRVLLAADAHFGVLTSSIAALPPAERRFDLIKLSHHGSQGNLSRGLLDIAQGTRFAVSTDGSRHDHPDPEAIARILLWREGRKHFYFNYRHEEAAMWDNPTLQQDYEYMCDYPPEGEEGRMRIII